MTPPFAIDNIPESHLVLGSGWLQAFKDDALLTAANLGDLQRLFHRSVDDRQRHER